MGSGPDISSVHGHAFRKTVHTVPVQFDVMNDKIND